MQVEKLEGFLTTEEVAKRLRCTKQNIHKMIRAGRFPGVRKIGTGKPIYLIPMEEARTKYRILSNEEVLSL